MDGVEAGTKAFRDGATFGIGRDVVAATQVGGKLVLEGIDSERSAQRELRHAERLVTTRTSGDGDKDKIVLPPNHLASKVETPKMKVQTEMESILKYVILAMSIAMTVMFMLLIRPEPKVEYVRATPAEVTPNTPRAQGAHGSETPVETEKVRLRQACTFGQELCRQAQDMDLPNVGEICAQAEETCSHLNK